MYVTQVTNYIECYNTEANMTHIKEEKNTENGSTTEHILRAEIWDYPVNQIWLYEHHLLNQLLCTLPL